MSAPSNSHKPTIKREEASAIKRARGCVCLCVLAGFFYEGKMEKVCRLSRLKGKVNGCFGDREKSGRLPHPPTLMYRQVFLGPKTD
jgi:hypothetical protein